MIDRSEFDRRCDARARMARCMAGRAWRQETILPAPAPRAALAALLLAVAARLVPATGTGAESGVTVGDAPALRLSGWE